MDSSEKEKLIDDEHLRLLGLAYLIDGCITIVFSCLFIFHFAFMLFFAGNPEFFEGAAQPEIAPMLDTFRLFAYLIGFFIVLGILYGSAKILSWKFIKERRHRMFSYVVAIPGLIFVPYGTLLGIAALSVLGRQTVIDQFESSSPHIGHVN